MTQIGEVILDDPESEILRAATIRMAQLPLGGIAEMGTYASASSSDVFRRYATSSLTGDRLRPLLERTVSVHGELGIHNLNLRKGLPFAWELVQSGVVNAICRLADADNDAVTPTLGEITPGMVDKAADYLEATDNPLGVPNRLIASGLFAAVDAKLRSTEGRAAIDPYHDAIRAAARDPLDPIGAKNLARGDGMASLAPLVHEVLAPYETIPGIQAFAGALCAPVDPALLAKHFGPPPA